MYKSTLALAASALLGVASAYDGDGTFYGAGGNGAAGACMLQPGFNGVGVTVAMNGAQFQGACGRCVRLTGTGQGQGGSGATPIFGPVYAVVDNECPECHYGDVDFGLNGDGRWRISWDFVDCGEARSQGSNIPQPDYSGPHWIHLQHNSTTTTTTTGAAQNNAHRGRFLRGAAVNGTTNATTGFWLEPGYMVTKNGIRLIEEVVAEQKAAATATGSN